jgi:hypothetical protein
VNPDTIRVELEVAVAEGPDSMGMKMLAGGYVHIYGESRWKRFINRLRKGKQ